MKKYKIHKEGFRILLSLSCILFLANLALFVFFHEYHQFRVFFALISSLAFIFTLSFFRIPLFTIAENDEFILAPADGKVVAIEEVDEKEYFNDKRIQVSIFMSPTNVHVNRSPIKGTVKYTKYHPGNYLVAWHPKSSEKNERFTSVIESEQGELEIMVRQIAGKVARKISNYLDEGQDVLQGMELGFIKFGSRVDIFFPIDTEIIIDMKQKVKGGKTVLAKLKK